MEDSEHGRVAPDSKPAPATPAPVENADADIDLTGIDPVHWAETRERVAILRAWCANGRHPRREALAAAARMGTTVSHFYRLVATWKKHRDALLVSGHPARRGDARSPRSIAAEVRAIMTRVIEEMGAEARFTDVFAAVRTDCATAGVAAPSSNLVHKMMMRARQVAGGKTRGRVDDIAVAVVSCLLPVTVDGRTVAAPDLVLAVERPGGTIVGHSLVIDGGAAGAARALLAGLQAEGNGRILVAATLAGAAGKDADDMDAEAGRPFPGPAQDAQFEVVTRSTLLSTTLGSYIDSIPIRHRRSASRAPGPWKPLSPADAVTAIDMAVAAHNAARSG